MSGRWHRLAAALAASFVAAHLVASCNLLADIPRIDEQNGGNGPTVVCATDAQCDDHDPCTADSCGADKACVFAALDGQPAPDAAQTSGDCSKIVCTGGVGAPEPDPADLPDDGEDCTFDTCELGVPAHTPKTKGTPCLDAAHNAGSCDGGGACVVACTVAGDCPAGTNPCVQASCDVAHGVCVYPALPEGMETPGVTQTPGDCHRHICVAGADVDQVDDSDVPATANDCDLELCQLGVASNPPKTGHLPCGTFNGNLPGFCDDAGACSECKDDSDCAGKLPSDDCRHPACVAFACVEIHDAAGKVTTSNPAQVPGDCQKITCDGSGGTTLVYDATDPANDNNVCTTDACAAASTTTHAAVPDGTKTCGVNNALTCVGGACAGCTVANQATQCPQVACADATTVQLAQVCSGTGTCGNPTPATHDCAPFLCAAGACTSKCNQDADCAQTGVGNYCTGPNGTCVARLAQGAVCAASHPFACQSGACVDGVCCNNACNGLCLACTAARKGSGMDGQCGGVKAGTDPDAECADQGAASCGTNGSCDGGGACQRYGNGTACLGASCADATTLNKPHTCNGSGSCVTPSPSTQGCVPFVCASNACGTSCANDGQCAPGFVCSGGSCAAKLPQGSSCASSGQCQSGFCVDAFCCDTACGAACLACAAAKKQSGMGSGACGAAKDAVADPRGVCAMQASATCGTDGLCAGGACHKWSAGTACSPPVCSGNQLATSACDGSGTCAGSMPGACPGNFACASGSACATSCATPDAAGDLSCAGGYYCDFAKTCQATKPTNAFCLRDGECSNGACLGGSCN
jgi:hypothetical protein